MSKSGITKSPLDIIFEPLDIASPKLLRRARSDSVDSHTSVCSLDSTLTIEEENVDPTKIDLLRLHQGCYTSSGKEEITRTKSGPVIQSVKSKKFFGLSRKRAAASTGSESTSSSTMMDQVETAFFKPHFAQEELSYFGLLGAENTVFLKEFEQKLEETLATHVDKHSKVAWLKRKKAQEFGINLREHLSEADKTKVSPTKSEIAESVARPINLSDRTIVNTVRDTLKATEENMRCALPANAVFGLTKKNVVAIAHRGNMQGFLHIENGQTHCVTPVESRVSIHSGEELNEANEIGMTVVEIGDDNPRNKNKGKQFTFAFFGNDNLFHVIPKKTLVKTINKSLRKNVPCSEICENLVKAAQSKNSQLDYSINLLAWQ